jgi:ferric-dicitrate binding protein FerR (iron transport regulator)
VPPASAGRAPDAAARKERARAIMALLVLLGIAASVWLLWRLFWGEPPST